MLDHLVWVVFICIMVLFSMGMGALVSTAIDNISIDEKSNK